MPMKPYIPKDLLITHRPEQDFEADNGRLYRVFSSFAVDASNAKRVKTAMGWSQQPVYGDGPHPDPIKVPNAPITNLRILSMEVRGGGGPNPGRAYKIITEERRMFDLREDVLLDAILNTGIKPGGVLPGHYVWVRYAPTNSKLMRLGSQLIRDVVPEDNMLEWLEKSLEEEEFAPTRADRLREREV